MLFLQLLLLAVLFIGGDNEEAFQEPISYHVIHISSHYNRSWEQNWGSGWLEELQTHRWESNSGTIVFLRPWSRSNFSKKEFEKLETLFRMYFLGFTRAVHTYDGQFQLEYPFEFQLVAGCELLSGEEPKGFLRAAYEGLDFLSFRNYLWVPSPEGGVKAQDVCLLLNLYQGIKEAVHGLIDDSCPRFLLGLLEQGKAELRREVKPKARLSSGTSPGPGHVLLICHVFGFYPKPVWVMWMRGKQELPGTQRGDVLPNADGTWYLRVYLNVTAREASGLSCRVRHSSLAGQDIVLYWEHHGSVALIVVAVMVSLLLLTGLVIWFRRHCFHENLLESLRHSCPFGTRSQHFRSSGNA